MEALLELANACATPKTYLAPPSSLGTAGVSGGTIAAAPYVN